VDLTGEVQARLDGLGYELVDIRRRRAGRRVRLQIRIDRPDTEPGSGITVDECARVSRALETWLDEEQVLGSSYVLEVSSPGIERPLRWRRHWERFAGWDVNVRLPDRPRLRATIVRVDPDDDVVVLRPSEGGDELAVRIGEIRDATLAVDWDAIVRGARTK
jgi:ribosome maturation factor RimP